MNFNYLAFDPGTWAAIVQGIVSAAVGLGVSVIIGAVTKQKNQPQQVQYPPNDVTRGGYLPVLIGRRKIGCHICWIGARQWHDTYYTENVMHGLCHGPIHSIHRMWSGDIAFWTQELDAATTADGATITLNNKLGAARLYFGRDAQPADPFLITTAATGKSSHYPGLAYILWYLRDLGPQTTWPPQAYEIETRPDEIAAACGLDLSFLGVPSWMDESTPATTTANSVTVWFAGKASLPAGTYTIAYDEGAYKLAPARDWVVHSHVTTTVIDHTTHLPVTIVQSFTSVVNGSGAVLVECPGNNTGYTTQALAEAGNAGLTASFTLASSGPVGIRFSDTSIFYACVPGTPNPTFTITSGSTTHTLAITVNAGAPGSGDGGANPMAALFILLCAPFPYGCAIPTSAIDLTAMAAAAAVLNAERLAINVLVDEGKLSADAIGSLLSDIGMLLPQVGGKLVPYLIRAETTVPEITDDLQEGPPPEEQRITAPLLPDRFTFTIPDVLNNYAVSDVSTDDDAQATANQRPQTQAIGLDNIISRFIAYQVGMRKTMELASQVQKVSSFKTLRETRNPKFHPGRSFVMNGTQYRVTSWRPDVAGIEAELEAILDQYGDNTNDPGTGTGGNSLPIPSIDNVEPDTFFLPFILPREWRVSLTTPIFGVPRVRATTAATGAVIWISTTIDGVYQTTGEQDPASAGGTLVAAFNSTPGVLGTGPNITPYDDDILDVPDLTGDSASYNAGALTIVCEQEIMLLESLTANMDGTYTFNNVTRGAFETTVAAHAIGTPCVIVVKSNLSQLYSALLLANQGGTLWIKTQPTDGTHTVDLSLVLPQPLYVPVNLIATITITAPAGAAVIAIGSTTNITWRTTDLTGNLKIEYSGNGGSTWSTLAASVADTGSYSWNTTGLTATSDAEIRISSVATPPVLDVTYPFVIGTVTAPSVPSPIAIAGEEQVALNWPAVTGATAYNVKRGVTGGPYTTIATIVSEPGGVVPNSYVDAGLTNGTQYCYVVSALTGSAESANSSEACATPFHCDCTGGTTGTPCGPCEETLEIGDSFMFTRCRIFAFTCLDIGDGDSGTFTDTHGTYTWVKTDTVGAASGCHYTDPGPGCTDDCFYITITRTA